MQPICGVKSITMCHLRVMILALSSCAVVTRTTGPGSIRRNAFESGSSFILDIDQGSRPRATPIRPPDFWRRISPFALFALCGGGSPLCWIRGRALRFSAWRNRLLPCDGFSWGCPGIYRGLPAPGVGGLPAGESPEGNGFIGLGNSQATRAARGLGRQGVPQGIPPDRQPGAPNHGRAPGRVVVG